MDSQDFEINKTQVKSNHYSFDNYLDSGHWKSYYNQIRACFRNAQKGSNIVIIGKGDNIVPLILKQILKGCTITTIDFAQDLSPDICCDILELSKNYNPNSADIVLCCQVLEHLKFERFNRCLNEISTILKPGGTLILSLPDGGILFRLDVSIPRIKFLIQKKICRIYKKRHTFNGQHYWEINSAKPYRIKRIRSHIENYFIIEQEYLTQGYEYHRFFICKK